MMLGLASAARVVGTESIWDMSAERTMMQQFVGQVAVVTGGGSGIGRATCLRFANAGAAVVVAEVNEETGARTAADIVEDGGKSLFVQTDVSDESSVATMVAAVTVAYGRIDILVNNAAIFVLKGIDATVDDWQQILGVNVIGTALTAKHAVPEMRKVGGGAIINLASISTHRNRSEDDVVTRLPCLADVFLEGCGNRLDRIFLRFFFRKRLE